jgi:hypothetical protein
MIASDVPMLWSYKSKLPSKELHLLLVGPLHRTRPLAVALLQVTTNNNIDNNIKNNNDDNTDDAAIAALRQFSLVSTNSSVLPYNTRRIHLCQRLDSFSSDIRMDHIVIVLSMEDNDSDDDKLSQLPLHIETEYTLYQRISRVMIINKRPVEHQRRRQQQQRQPQADFYIHSQESHIHVARRILQRASIGARQTPVSPMIYGTYP